MLQLLLVEIPQPITHRYTETNNFTLLQEYINNPVVSMFDIAKIGGTNWAKYGIPARPLVGTTINKFTASNYGYPAETGHTGFKQYVTSGTFEYDASTRMYKTTNTFSKGGMSGGPLNTNGVIGLLSGGNATTDYFVPMYQAYMDFLRK
ncbi:hypothetical protein ACWOFR_10085 [Carnobacterium gallinarum]|uniref:hypothetical protein n=1 Tax=Carnobacterium gallinarum TaxID=2749 RepID=UPI000550D6DC|nr:hypothetical protein [Carnobacterium gallinarum]